MHIPDLTPCTPAPIGMYTHSGPDVLHTPSCKGFLFFISEVGGAVGGLFWVVVVGLVCVVLRVRGFLTVL